MPRIVNDDARIDCRRCTHFQGFEGIENPLSRRLTLASLPMVCIPETDDVFWQGVQPIYEKVFHSISVCDGGSKVAVKLVVVDSNDDGIDGIVVGKDGSAKSAFEVCEEVSGCAAEDQGLCHFAESETFDGGCEF